jgi:predicted RNA-binding protein with PUA domain
MIIDDVPAWVCQQCGEPLFEEQAVEAVQGILHEMDLRVTNLTALTLAPA